MTSECCAAARSASTLTTQASGLAFGVSGHSSLFDAECKRADLSQLQEDVT